MAKTFDNGQFSFTPEELKDLSKIIHESIYNDPMLGTIHMVETGIKYDMQIVLAGGMGLMGKKVTGCTPNKIDGIKLSEKFWTPVQEDFRLEHCSTSVNEQDKLFRQMSKMNPDFYDIISGSQSRLGALLIALLDEQLKSEILRKVWFNDKDAAIAGTGNGTITPGTDLGFFNTFNGLFRQIFDSTTVKKVAITENNGLTYDAQELTPAKAYGYLKAVLRNADIRLRNRTDLYFLVTQTIYDGYLDYIEDVQNKGAGNTTITENGQTYLAYRGIKLIPMQIWDRTIESYYNDGTKYDLPHRIVLSFNSNLRVGTLAESDFGTIDAFYDKVTKQNYIDGIYTIDSKLIEDYLTSVAY